MIDVLPPVGSVADLATLAIILQARQQLLDRLGTVSAGVVAVARGSDVDVDLLQELADVDDEDVSRLEQ